MVSNTDLKLIAALEEDGRASYIELAQNLGINPSTVAKRVRSILNDGLIDVKAIPNPYKMGHNANAMIGMNVDLRKIDKVCKKLLTKFHINLILTTFGCFNVILGVHHETWDKLIGFISELSENSDIEELQPFFIKGMKKRFRSPVSGEYAQARDSTLDTTDFRIIEELSRNGRYSCMYLSSKLGISLSSASKRLASLIKDDVIQVRAITNPNRMGYLSNGVVLVRAERSCIDDLCNSLHKIEDISTLMTLMNGYDIYLGILSKTPETLQDLINNRIAVLPGIKTVETLVCGEIVKRYYSPFRPENDTNHIA